MTACERTFVRLVNDTISSSSRREKPSAIAARAASVA